MLDVHPPEHGIHSIRDFSLHLLTISVGLLIAIALEQSVEAVHHRHQRIEAEETIRQEITENRAALQHMQMQTATEIKSLELALVFAEDLRSGQKDDPSNVKLGFSATPLGSAGWSTASATGALSYMNYGEAQRYATAYLEQQNYQTAVAQALSQYEILDTYLIAGQDPRNLKPQDVEAAIPDLRRALADLHSMSDWGRGTLRSYEDALK